MRNAQKCRRITVGQFPSLDAHYIPTNNTHTHQCCVVHEKLEFFCSLVFFLRPSWISLILILFYVNKIYNNHNFFRFNLRCLYFCEIKNARHRASLVVYSLPLHAAPSHTNPPPAAPLRARALMPCVCCTPIMWPLFRLDTAFRLFRCYSHCCVHFSKHQKIPINSSKIPIASHWPFHWPFRHLIVCNSEQVVAQAMP